MEKNVQIGGPYCVIIPQSHFAKAAPNFRDGFFTTHTTPIQKLNL